MAKVKKEKLTKVFLKQKRAHKKGFRLGRHLVKLGPAKEYELNESEVSELKTAGPQAWLKVITQKEMDAIPKTNAENKKIQDLKKFLVEKEVKLEGDESLEELTYLKEEVEMKVALIAAVKEKGVELSGEESVEQLEEMLEAE